MAAAPTRAAIWPRLLGLIVNTTPCNCCLTNAPEYTWNARLGNKATPTHTLQMRSITMNHVRFHNRARCFFQLGVDMRKQIKETSTRTSKAFQADNPGDGDQNIDNSATIVYKIMNLWIPPKRLARGRFRISMLAIIQHSMTSNRSIRISLTVSTGSSANSPAVLIDPRCRLTKRRNHIRSS